MELDIYYQNNETGRKLYKNILEITDQVECNYAEINDQLFLDIRVKDNNQGPVRRINSARAIVNSLCTEECCKMLRINGFICGDEIEESILKTYEVLLWGLRCISFRVWAGARERGKVKTLRERENMKLVDTARRAMYILGLDLGLVIVAFTARRRFKVMSIDPSPHLGDKELTAIVKRILDWSSLDIVVKQRDVKLGADPEFMMFNSRTGKIIAASNHFPREGVVGCDNIRMPNRTQRPIAELRPKPDYSPLVLTSNIKQALQIANQLAPFKNVRWAAGSQPGGGFSIGGHIHFSNTRLNAAMLRALDNYLGLPIFMIENQTTAVRRRKRYGRLGDYRIKDYGGFEYRTPGSWLISQSITLAILCLAKIVISRYPWLPANYLNNLPAQQAFYQGNQEYFLPVFEKLWKHIESLDMYETYKEHLTVLYEMIVNRTYWNENIDFRKAWMLPSSSRRSGKSERASAGVYSTEQRTNGPVQINPNIISVQGSGSTRSRINSMRQASPGSSGRIIGPNQVRRNHRLR